MSEYIKQRVKNCVVEKQFSGHRHFFKVIHECGKEHNVSIDVNCDCRYMSVQGVPNGRICSDIVAVMQNIVEKCEINIDSHSDILQMKRNICTNLVRASNRELNTVRISSSESIEHQNKKIEVCKALKLLGKHFMTEAILDKCDLRADILILDEFKIIEIVHTETAESIIEKIKKANKLCLSVDIIKC